MATPGVRLKGNLRPRNPLGNAVFPLGHVVNAGRRG